MKLVNWERKRYDLFINYLLDNKIIRNANWKDPSKI